MLSRLIFPKLVEIARFDTAATQTAGRVDEQLGELRVTNANDGTARAIPRTEVLVQVRAQIETDTFLQMQSGGLGNSPSSRRVAVCLARDLEAAGLFEASTGVSLLKPTDRLARILTLAGVQLEAFPVELSVGLYATKVSPAGYGYGGGRANLLEILFEDRAVGTRSSGGFG